MNLNFKYASSLCKLMVKFLLLHCYIYTMKHTAKTHISSQYSQEEHALRTLCTLVYYIRINNIIVKLVPTHWSSNLRLHSQEPRFILVHM